MWLEAGGLYFHCQSPPSSFSSFWILAWSISSIAFLSSFSHPTKLVPLSDRIILTLPLLPMKRLKAKLNMSVSRLLTTSRCTALTFRQVKITPCLFNSVLLCLMTNCPNKSTHNRRIVVKTTFDLLEDLTSSVHQPFHEAFCKWRIWREPFVPRFLS